MLCFGHEPERDFAGAIELRKRAYAKISCHRLFGCVVAIATIGADSDSGKILRKVRRTPGVKRLRFQTAPFPALLLLDKTETTDRVRLNRFNF